MDFLYFFPVVLPEGSHHAVSLTLPVRTGSPLAVFRLLDLSFSVFSTCLDFSTPLDMLQNVLLRVKQRMPSRSRLSKSQWFDLLPLPRDSQIYVGTTTVNDLAF